MQMNLLILLIYRQIQVLIQYYELQFQVEYLLTLMSFQSLLSVLNDDKKPVPIVDERGRYVSSMKKFAGRFVKKEFDQNNKNESLDVDIAVFLKKEGKVFRVEKYEHNYPHCWRTWNAFKIFN